MSTGSTRKNSLIGSAGTVSSATAFSRVLGLIREQVMAWFFGAGMATDAFVTAFRIPNLLRDMFAEGALSAAFVPVFKEKLVKATNQDAFHLANVVATAILMLVGAIVLLGILAAPVLIYITANGFVDTPDKFELTVSLTRIMMVYLLLVSISALIMGMLNSFGRFAIPALSPAMFNIGVVLSVILLYKGFNQPAYSLAIGVVIGGIGQLVIQLPSLVQIGFRFRPVVDLLDEGLRKVIRLITPMIVGMSAGRVNILLSTLLASFLVEGSISYLNYSYRLMHFPLGVFAVALGTVTLPHVSEMVARGDREGLLAAFNEAISLNLLVVLPSAMFLAFLGDEVVALIYQWGRFSEANAANTSLALLHYSYGLVGFAAVRVTVPFYYAHGDSRLPMRISIISVLVNMALYYPLIKLLNFAGLAAATSLAGLLNFALLLYYLPTKGIFIPWRELTVKTIKIVAAAALAFLIANYIPVIAVEGSGRLFQRFVNLAVPSVVAGFVYVGLCFLFGVGEIRQLLNKLLPGRRAGA